MTEGTEGHSRGWPRPPRGNAERWAALVIGGLLHGAAFNLVLHPRVGLVCVPPALAGLALMVWSLRGVSLRRGAGQGAAGFALAAAAGLFWVNTVSPVGYLGIAVYFAGFGALFGLGAALLRRGAGAWGWPPLVAALWTALEFLRAYLFTGFPWMLAGGIWAGVPPAMGPAALAGVYGVSFLTVLAAALAVGRGPRRSWARILLTALALGAGPGYGLVRSHQLREPNALRIRVAAVQPLVPFKVGPEKVSAEEQIAEQKKLMDGLAPGEVNLVIWSETMVPGELLERDEELLAPLAREKRCWLLAGGVVHETGAAGELTGRNWNSAVLISPEGKSAGRYDKRHLVPFGEYVPLGGRFPGASFVFHLIGTTFSPGGREQTLPRLAGAPLGVSICYEDVFPHIARADAERGARLLVNLTNDSWFKRSSEARQHLALAAFRAVETRRPLVRATNTGISALVEPDGRITVPPGGGLWEKGLVRMDLRIPPARRTPYMAVGDLFAWACAGAAVLGAIAGIVRILVHRSRGRREPSLEPQADASDKR